MEDSSASLLEQLETGIHISNMIINTDKKGKADQTFERLSNRLQLLESYWKTFVGNHGKVCRENAGLAKDHPYFSRSQFYEIEDAYVTAKTELTARLARLTSARDGDRGASAASASLVQMLPTPPSLPSLTLPTFNGDQRNWESFKELFSSMVKDVPHIANVQKLQRLLSSLEGSAAARLRNIPLVGTNFEVAWSILLKSYDNNRIKLADHLKRLLSMPPMATRSAPEITRLLDTVEEATRSLISFGRDVDHWDDWFIQLVELRLDSQTREDWEKSLEHQEDFPLYKDLKSFLEHRSRTLQASSSMEAEHPSNRAPSKKPPHVTRAHSTHMARDRQSTPGKATLRCVLCREQHRVSWCPKFKDLSLDQRKRTVRQHNLCYNCLGQGHGAAFCPSVYRCKISGCGASHHTLLHEGAATRGTTDSSTGGEPSAPTGVVSLHSGTRHSGVVLLATAQVAIQSSSGRIVVVKALLDQGSETSFLSTRVAQDLELPKRRSSTLVFGLGAQHGTRPSSEVDVLLRSITSPFTLRFSALVLPKLTSLLPSKPVVRASWTHLEGLTLADTEFDKMSRVDCILGADVYPALILDGLIKGGRNEPIAQRTTLGWVISGLTPSPAEVSPSLVRCHTVDTDYHNVAKELRRFWELEEILPTRLLSREDQACEDHFSSTHVRDSSGRYVLRLPFSRSPNLPSTFAIARARLLGTERRLVRKPNEQKAYVTFMKEYEDLHHMERIEKPDLDKENYYYIPHHAVFKADGSGKIRVVFNASQDASNGLSLNDCLHAGPKLQRDISVILTGWRYYRFVFSADIVKIPDGAIQHYRLTTVTYGTACAPFQAIRVLLQLASDERLKFPVGASILERNVYVDDALAGADTLENAKDARDQLAGILHSAGMELDKWSPNHPALLTGLSDVSTRDLPIDAPDVVSTLGLLWSPRSDAFRFRVNHDELKPPTTKRAILSIVARLFDPMGWLGPVLIRAKIPIQKLWLQGCNWDDPLDISSQEECDLFCRQLRDVEGISIPRFLGRAAETRWYLHGFADASERAYGACLYFLTQDDHGEWKSTLITAKTKVAPIKSISVPRLELCAALLLAKLVAFFRQQLHPEPIRTFCWSDLTMVLAWIRDHPSRWQTFVDNRVSEIHCLIPQTPWGHVRTEENPADASSRGLCPSELRTNRLWWHGPSWLLKDWSRWKTEECEFVSALEARPPRQVLAHHVQPEGDFPFTRFSSWQRLIHTVAYALRWLNRLRRVPPQYPYPGLEAREIHAATSCVLRLVQREAYSEELHCLSKGAPLPRASTIRRCSPFLHENGVLRVGGRLQNTTLPFEEKHPAIVPRKSHLAALILRDTHLNSLHGGPQLMLSCLRRRFWIPQVRSDVRREVRRCTRCARFQGPLLEQQMAPLPSTRGTPSRPFSTCGLDYAGPFPIRMCKGRGQRATKGYLVIFVELCPSVWSDNGTTLQGADQELKRLFHSAATFSKEIAETLANDGVTWNFIPPRAPYFGGLWEAGVRSFKHHLKRVVGDAKLTFEEFSTLAVQIEACLNSCPLSPLSSDVEDLAPLTPEHFLIGSALLAPAEPSDTPAIPRVERYRLATVMRNHFWIRWRKEVLHEYQLRSKWLLPTKPLKVGDLVLISDINTPAISTLGRVLELHEGSDDLARVATLKTATTTLSRPLVKLIRLPIDDGPEPGQPPLVKVGGSQPLPIGEGALHPELSQE
ncbi:uncharacterized protein LOC131670868 [Phymastichus coffea]|uniref:uncharacterized protein LOC131670868 n=1 Tax=Phymastichus coffea TaxID=108790 RepID=UPI00273A8701|nr:uncharacterized protein LOC131670868 [Phymastichus coffea]